MAPFFLFWLPVALRPFVLGWLAVGTVLLMTVLSLVDKKLKTHQAPRGIVSFELSGSTMKTRAILDSWDEHARRYALLSLMLDYLFIASYATTLALACVVMSSGLKGQLGSRVAALGPSLAWAQIIAGCLDALENASLIALLRGVATGWLPPLARRFAIGKFALVGLGILYLVLCIVVRLAGGL